MSWRRSLEQDRADAAWDCIQQVKRQNERLPNDKQYGKEFASLARSAPTDIQANGLGQTLAFWRAKGYEKGQPKNEGANAPYVVLEHTCVWIRKRLALMDNNVLEWIVKRATTNEYRRATTEAIAFLVWLKRFAEAELGGDEGALSRT